MGKPFRTEIEQLEHTYLWASNLDVSKLSKHIEGSWYVPLFSVGSGGSLSGAEFQAFLHRTFFSTVSQAVTPIELISSLPNNGEASVNFLSASGNNIDVYRAFQHATLNELRFVSSIICNMNSKIQTLAAKYQYTRIFEINPPFGRDGFLATNSLLTFFIILYKAYSKIAGKKDFLPPTLEDLVNSSLAFPKGIENIKKQVSPIWEKQAIHLIHSHDLKAIALDIESKFTEAGLNSIHLSDFRNFAHGRHHWFAKREINSAIISFSTQKEQDLSQRTLDLLPDGINKFHLCFKNIDGLEVIAGLIFSIYFTGWLGEKKKIDPGKPGVPRYGSKIYRLSANPGYLSRIKKKEIAIKRKKRLAPSFYANENHDEWEKSYKDFNKNLSKQVFSGVVLDYDGTVVDSDKRYFPPDEKIINEFVRLLKNDILIGFATGRGKSIRKDLQKVIPESLWDRIIIGYYNGGEIKKLSDNSALKYSTKKASDDLKKIQAYLSKNIFLSSLAEFEPRKHQLTIKNKTAVSETFLWDLIQNDLYSTKLIEGEVLRSSHSIDIISKGVSKLAVIEEFKKTTPKDTQILTIGDRGKWPGNDARLLRTPFSLSVDEVSYSNNSCWNLCPAGIKGAQGTYYYLTKLKFKASQLRFML